MNSPTNVCPQCSTSLPGGAVFCGECGHSVSDSASTMLAAPSPAAAPHAAPQPSAPYAQQPYPPTYPQSGAYPAPAPAQAGSSLPKTLGAVLVAGGLVALGAWGWMVMRPDDAAKTATTVATASAAPSASASATTASAPATPQALAATGNATPTGASAPAAAAPAQVTVTQVVTAPPAQPALATPQQGGSAELSNTAPGPAIAPSASWILVLDSLEQKRYSPDEAETRSDNTPGSTMVVDSSRTPGLRSGYWAVVSSDWYSTKKAAESACGQHGRSISGSCYGRRIG